MKAKERINYPPDAQGNWDIRNITSNDPTQKKKTKKLPPANK